MRMFFAGPSLCFNTAPPIIQICAGPADSRSGMPNPIESYPGPYPLELHGGRIRS